MTTNPCPGCPAPIAANLIACPPCHRRLPSDLRAALKAARQRRQANPNAWHDATHNAREWLTQRRKDQP